MTSNRRRRDQEQQEIKNNRKSNKGGETVNTKNETYTFQRPSLFVCCFVYCFAKNPSLFFFRCNIPVFVFPSSLSSFLLLSELQLISVFLMVSKQPFCGRLSTQYLKTSFRTLPRLTTKAYISCFACWGLVKDDVCAKRFYK